MVNGDISYCNFTLTKVPKKLPIYISAKSEPPRTYLSKKARSDVPGTGIEPVRMLLHWCLRPTRLPIPPPGLTW